MPDGLPHDWHVITFGGSTMVHRVHVRARSVTCEHRFANDTPLRTYVMLCNVDGDDIMVYRLQQFQSLVVQLPAEQHLSIKLNVTDKLIDKVRFEQLGGSINGTG